MSLKFLSPPDKHSAILIVKDNYMQYTFNQTMKVAVCFSGQIRFYHKSFDLVKKHLLDIYNPDVFIHTWYSPSYENKEFEKTQCKVSQGTYKIQDIQNCIQLYNPISILIEGPKLFFSFGHNTLENNLCSMLCSIYNSNMLKSNNELITRTKYDWVIRMRFDWSLTQPLCLEQLNNEFVYIPDYISTTTSNPNNPHVNDQLALGSSDNMNIYAESFRKYLNYKSNNVQTGAGENIIYGTLKDGGVNCKELPWVHSFGCNDALGRGAPNSLIRE